MSDWLKRLLAPVFAAVVCLLIWEDIVRLLDVPPYVLPAPTDVFDVLLNGGERSVALIKGAYQTALAASLGFLIAAIVGVTLGTLLASVGVLKRGLYPLANLLQMVPIIALAPLLNIWFGYGIAGVAASACIVAIFPVIASTVDGLGAIDPHHRELFDLYRASAPEMEVTWSQERVASDLYGVEGFSRLGRDRCRCWRAGQWRARYPRSGRSLLLRSETVRSILSLALLSYPR